MLGLGILYSSYGDPVYLERARARVIPGTVHKGGIQGRRDGRGAQLSSPSLKVDPLTASQT